MSGRPEQSEADGVASEVRAKGAVALPCQLDLADNTASTKLESAIRSEFGGLDTFIHCAGAYAVGSLQETPVSTLDELYYANVRAAYTITQALLPLLTMRKGQIVFVNSSQGLQARGNSIAFAATQHALKAFADGLRQEVNAFGVRVLSVFPGRTATPRIAALYASQGTSYRPEFLMQPDDVAQFVLAALRTPRTAEVTNIEMRPLVKSY